MPMKKKLVLLTYNKYSGKKYLRQPSIDFDFCNISSPCDVVYKGKEVNGTATKYCVYTVHEWLKITVFVLLESK
jgi:hypothetical protein